MFWEYLSLAGAFSDFSFSATSILRIAVAVLVPLAIVSAGYAIKGVWGAVTVVLLLTLIFLHATDNWWILRSFGLPIP